jgi:hypothetical protein
LSEKEIEKINQEVKISLEIGLWVDSSLTKEDIQKDIIFKLERFKHSFGNDVIIFKHSIIEEAEIYGNE